MHILRLTIILFSILLLFTMCSKKDKAVEYVRIPVPDSLKHIDLFGKGSYWIYKNDTTGEIDCTYVSGDPLQDELAYGKYLVESDSMPLSSKIFRFFTLQGNLGPTGWSTGPGSPFLAGLQNYSQCANHRTAFVLFGDTASYHEGKHIESCGTTVHDQVIYDGDEFQQVERLQSMTINGIEFDSVFVTRTAFFLALRAYDTLIFYYRPRIGVLKVVLAVDTSFGLTGDKYTKFSWGILRYNVHLEPD